MYITLNSANVLACLCSFLLQLLAVAVVVGQTVILVTLNGSSKTEDGGHADNVDEHSFDEHQHVTLPEIEAAKQEFKRQSNLRSLKGDDGGNDVPGSQQAGQGIEMPATNGDESLPKDIIKDIGTAF